MSAFKFGWSVFNLRFIPAVHIWHGPRRSTLATFVNVSFPAVDLFHSNSCICYSFQLEPSAEDVNA